MSVFEEFQSERDKVIVNVIKRISKGESCEKVSNKTGLPIEKIK